MAYQRAPSVSLRPRSDPQNRLSAALRLEEQSGLRLVLYARFFVLAILLVWAFATTRAEFAIVYAGIIAAFALFGVLPLLLQRYGIANLQLMALFFTLDVVLLTYILMVPGSMFPSTLTPQFNLQLPNFLYLCLFVVGMAISYSPGLVLWTGMAAIIAWSIGMFWILSMPETLAFSFSELLDPARFTDEERVRTTSSRLFVSLTHWHNRIFFLGLVTLVLAATVWRSRSLLKRQISSETARANLSRYFSPSMVDRLSSSDGTLEDVDTRDIAILFVDIVGFTECAERMGPHGVIEMLRHFHGRMARIVFAHDGTIDKYIGDALMANFGSPVIGKYDGTNALKCAYAMVEEMAQWNSERRERGEEPIDIGIGVHFGEVVSGNIGDENHLEFAVLGDTVNVASRLERSTRDLNSPIVVSAELVERIRNENRNSEALVSRLVEDPTTTVRGRIQPVKVWHFVADKP